MTGPRLGVDVGGTFTDVVAVDGEGIRVAKVPSTPDDQAEGVLAGIGDSAVDLAAVDRFAHGTTVATNTVLERDGARTVLVATAGFRDLLVIGRQDRPALYDLTATRPAPVVARDRVVEVEERVGADGTVVRPLTDGEIDRVVEAVAGLEPQAVAVSLLFSFLADDHERRLVEALSAALDGVPVTRASAVLPVFREFERTSTAAMNAYVAPRMARYLRSLETRLRDRGLSCPLEVMRSGGGTFTADLAVREPVHTLLSGPAGGAWGAAAVGRAAGVEDVIALDMGGTSADVTLVEGGRPRTTAEGRIGGLPFAVSTTDIHTVGSGGGSIAWVDAGGALRVGPRSAGARPGPACYGRGGTDPTVTDANLLLGRIDPEVRLGGHMELRADLAREALTGLGDELGMEPGETAAGILRVVEAQMVKALRVVSVEKGHDPRDFTLIPFGGAGPLHQAALARELGCRRVLLPPRAGVLSALGLLATPVTVTQVRTHLARTGEVDGGDLAGIWQSLEDTGRARMLEQRTAVADVERTADLRYHGQAFELEVPAGDGDPGELTTRFHDHHRRRYGYAQPDEPVEVVNLRVRLEAATPALPLPGIEPGEGAETAVVRHHEVHLEGGRRRCPVYARGSLGAGDIFAGPAVVTDVDTTCWVAPWQRVEVDSHGSLVIEGAHP